MDWFRWWHGTVTDPKMQWVARKSKQPVAVVIAVWACLLEHASDVTQCNAAVTRGEIFNFDCNDYDVLLGLDDGVVEEVLSAFEAKGMIVDSKIAKWEERQPKREDSSAARVAAHRARKKEQQDVSRSDDVKRDVTQCNAPDKDTDTEKEEKTNTKTIGAAVACAAAEHDPVTKEFETSVPLPAKKPTKQKSAAEQIELPDWVPADAWNAYEAMRKDRKKPMTAYAAKLIVNKLWDFMQAGYSPRDILDASTANCWIDVYAPKQPSNPARPAQQPARTQAEKDEANERALRLLGVTP